jgi:hypothetical protein
LSDANVRLVKLLKFLHFHQNLTKIVLSFCSLRFGELVISIIAVLDADHPVDSYDSVILLEICVTAVFEVVQYLHRTSYSFAVQLGFGSLLLVIQIITAGWFTK